LTSPESYGNDTAFIEIRLDGTLNSARPALGGSPLRVTGKLKKAGYPVFEFPLRREEDIGALFYIAEFASVGGYLKGINQFRKAGSVETLSPAEVVGSRLEEVWVAGAPGSGIAKVGPSKYPNEGKGANSRATEVIVVDVQSFLKIKSVKKITPEGMSRVFKVRPRSEGVRVFEVMEKIVKATKEEGNFDRVQFAFVSSTKGVTREVMDKMLRYYMSAYDLSAEVVDSNFVIDEKELKDAGGIGGILRTSKIDTKAVFSIINKRLLLSGRTSGDATKITIITDKMDRWKKYEETREKILWVLLNPVEEGRVVSTTGGLVITIEGEVCEWLRKFIEKEYPKEEAERLLAEINRDGKVILPVKDEERLEKMWFPEKTFRVEA